MESKKSLVFENNAFKEFVLIGMSGGCALGRCVYTVVLNWFPEKVQAGKFLLNLN